MKSATERLFGIPELVIAIALYLEMRDLVRFVRTNHQTYAACMSLLYRDRIDLRDTHKEILYSADSLRALARNAHALRVLRMDEHFLNFLYQSLLESNPDLPPLDVGEATSVSVRDIPLPQPSQDPQARASPAIYRTIPFQPMRQLTAILFITNPVLEVWRDPLLKCQGADLARVCHLVQLNPSLNFLTVCQVRIRTRDELDLLARTISGLSGLQRLFLSIVASEEVVHRVIPAISMCLPSSAMSVMLKLEFQTDEPSNLPPSASATETAADLMTALSEHREPLLNLYDLEIDSGVFMSVELIFAIFSRCPNLYRIDVPRVERVEDVERVAEFIVEHCPKIQEISQEDPTYDTSGSLILTIADRLPEHSLVEVCLEGYSEDEVERLGASLLRHCFSLERVVLRNCQQLSSASIDLILGHCSFLDTFEIDGDTPHTFALDLANAIHGIESTHLQELWLAVKIDDYYNQLGVVDLINTFRAFEDHPTETQLFRSVTSPYSSFYRSIGALTNLRILDLKVALEPRTRAQQQQAIADGYVQDPEDSDTDADSNLVGLEPAPQRYESYKLRCFPGLMTLGKELPDGRRGWGCLDLWQGLGNLEQLRGSFSVDAYRRHGQDFGEQEIRWIARWWPNLKVAEFYHAKKGKPLPVIAPHFKWLQERLPGLKVVVE
ncbi:hypothetical protein BGX29_011499 [Mortierella sp. GBA35]|nr:hypothetical protein BGX29_011499 [Mortierella sp. GBA35]